MVRASKQQLTDTLPNEAGNGIMRWSAAEYHRWSAASKEDHRMHASVGIDLGKTIFHLVALGERNKVLVRKKFSRCST